MRRLLIRPGAIGDLIVSLPALESLKTDYLEVWAAEQNLPLIRFADRVQSITSTGLDMLEIEPAPQLVERLRGFDSIVSWYGAGRPEFRDVVAKLGLPFQFFPALPVGCHAVDFFVEQALACSNRSGRLSACPTHLQGPVEQADSLSDVGDWAVIHPFASKPEKRWPMEKFRGVSRLLPMPVQWCAGPEEKLEGAVRIANLYELGCWLARARVYIGNDSGISHLAAAVGTPVVALFGPTDPAVWAPRGPRVRILERMESVEPADVLRAIEDL
jgi:heptosyltransferase-2